MTGDTKMRKYHAARWDEPVVMEMGRAGRRGVVFGEAEVAVREATPGGCIGR